jgi:hypothetical protein
MKVMKLFAMLAIVLLMAACGGSDTASKVASKIRSGEALTEADYTEMIEYCGKYATEAQKLQDRINVLSPTSEEAGKLTNELADLTQKTEYAGLFNDKISACTKEEIGEKNVALVNKYAPLTWFVAPGWADLAPASDVEGSIVDMPSTDTTGVIATGAGEMVAK